MFIARLLFFARLHRILLRRLPLLLVAEPLRAFLLLLVALLDLGRRNPSGSTHVLLRVGVRRGHELLQDGRIGKWVAEKTAGHHFVQQSVAR